GGGHGNSAAGHRRITLGSVESGLIESVGGGANGALQDGALIDTLLCERLVLVDANPFAGVQDAGLGNAQKVADFDGTFFVEHHGGGVVILYLDVENGAADGNDGAGRANFIVIGQATGVFDLDADFAQPDFEKIAPVAAVGTEDDFGFRKDLESAAVGNLEDAITVDSGHDNLFGLHE